jgi:hypothetical protein
MRPNLKNSAPPLERRASRYFRQSNIESVPMAKLTKAQRKAGLVVSGP